jgi:glycogen synthase
MPDVAVRSSRRPLRLVYAAGPGDVVGTFRHWKEGRDDPSQVAITYSGQFYELCRELGAEAIIVSHCPRRDSASDEKLRVMNRPAPFHTMPGPLYMLGQVYKGLWLTARAVAFRADAVVVMSGMTWFSLALLPLFGIKVVPTLHAKLWQPTHPPRGINRVVWYLNGEFFRGAASAVIYISDGVLEQLTGLTGEYDPDAPVLYFNFVPTYREGSFQSGEEGRPPGTPPFRVLYAGRVEPDKGVFDLLGVARRFAAEGRLDVEFDLCGSGSALDELRRQAEAAGVAPRFRCHGHLDKPSMRRMYRECHTVVVPTTTDSVEGLNKVVIESVLAGRPVITSPMCPAIEYVREACVEVPADDVKAYGDAILKLAEDRGFYERKREKCEAAGAQFYEPQRSWGATFRRVLETLGLVPAAEARPAAGPASLSAEPR